MSESAGPAVFLSYASQDAEAARRICEALRASGVEVWFDQNELVGGDAWDAKIRRQIKECALFMPVISANTNARAEGYFRLEWLLAVERSRLMSDDHPFLFPVVIDDTTDAAARVPDRFRDVQWTRLNVKDTPESLAARVARVLHGGREPERALAGAVRGEGRAKERKTSSPWLRYLAVCVGLTCGLIYAVRPLFQAAKPGEAKAPATEKSFAVAATAAPKISEARQLAEKARVLFDKIDSNADDYGVAESLLKRALELDATDGVIWAYSARLNAAYLTRSFERGNARAENARNHAERAVKLAPDSGEAWHALGRAIWRSDPPRAEEALRRALELSPTDGRILLSLGSINRNAGHDDEALAYYVRAAAYPEVRPLALYDQFLIHLYQRRFAEADRCGREATALFPTTNSVTGLAILDIVWHGRVDAARRTLAEAPAAMRAEPRMVFATALAALMAKQSDEALRALDRLPGDFINDAWYSGPKALFTGFAHAQGGRPEAARIAWETGIGILRRRLQDTPNEAELHLRLGELLAWTGQTDAALREARVFEELARNRSDWTFSSVRIYAALGRADDALPILEKFLAATGSGRWPFTPALLRLDPLWDKIRADPRIQKIAASDQAPASPAPAAKPDDKAVAVLPFANLSGDPAQDYFSDGFTEEILTALTNERDLRVPGLTSSLSFKGKKLTAQEIAQALNVAQLVEGSVRKAGDQVRITVKLTRASDGFSEPLGTFTEKVDDIFALQEKVARAVVEKLTKRTTTAGGVAVATNNPAAYDAYLRGRALQTGGQTLKSQVEMVGFFSEAVRLDAGYAQAWSRLAQAYLRGRRAGNRSNENAVKARHAAVTALKLAPDLPEAHLAMAEAHLYVDYDHDAARRELAEAERRRPNDTESPFLRVLLERERGGWSESIVPLVDRAVALDPQNADTLYLSGQTLALIGHFADGARLVERARQLSPTAGQFRRLAEFHLSRTGDAAGALAISQSAPAELQAETLSYLSSRANFHAMQGDFAAAIADYEKSRSAVSAEATSGLRINAAWTLHRIGLLEARRGNVTRAAGLQAQALAEIREIIRMFPEEGRGAATLAQIHAARGEKAEAIAALDRAGQITAQTRSAFDVALNRIDKAEALTLLGGADGAIAELRAVHEMGRVFGHSLRLNPAFAPLLAHPKFQQLAADTEARGDVVPRTKTK